MALPMESKASSAKRFSFLITSLASFSASRWGMSKVTDVAGEEQKIVGRSLSVDGKGELVRVQSCDT